MCVRFLLALGLGTRFGGVGAVFGYFVDWGPRLWVLNFQGQLTLAYSSISPLSISLVCRVFLVFADHGFMWDLR